jgi:hypothetical protein
MSSKLERADLLVWELVSVRCALARPVSDAVRASLRKQERAIVGALLDLGVFQHDEVAPLPPPMAAPPALF